MIIGFGFVPRKERVTRWLAKIFMKKAWVAWPQNFGISGMNLRPPGIPRYRVTKLAPFLSIMAMPAFCFGVNGAVADDLTSIRLAVFRSVPVFLTRKSRRNFKPQPVLNRG